MPHQVMVRSQPANGHRRRGVGEVAGSAAADCTAVCCCCPCTVVNLVVLAVYKLPKGLVEKAAHKRRRRMPKKNNTGDVKNGVVLLQAQRSSSVETRLEEFMKKEWEDEEKGKCEKEEEEGLEKEMWARFAGTGFWRSESQRQP